MRILCKHTVWWEYNIPKEEESNLLELILNKTITSECELIGTISTIGYVIDDTYEVMTTEQNNAPVFELYDDENNLIIEY